MLHRGIHVPPFHTHFTQSCWLTLHSFPTKGPEPENVTVGTVNGRTYAFAGLERIGGVMICDITDPLLRRIPELCEQPQLFGGYL